MIKGHIDGVCCFGIRWGICFPLVKAHTSVAFEQGFSSSPLCCILALSRPPHEPSLSIQSCWKHLGCVWMGNICSRGGSCVSRSDVPPVEPVTARGAGAAGSPRSRTPIPSEEHSHTCREAPGPESTARLCGGEAAHRHPTRGWGPWLCPHHQLSAPPQPLTPEPTQTLSQIFI